MAEVQKYEGTVGVESRWVKAANQILRKRGQIGVKTGRVNKKPMLRSVMEQIASETGRRC